ncbi:MAG TPA: ribonucleoside-diphosphate reductase subunit alpha [Candidatus Saccharimonadales bacterium]|nr:ribonucleoside-diphosphate reductase subunit alpha [Candidatus Saccharimonadales bacterium]
MAWEKFENVKKRDGTVVEFKPEKIAEAIRKAILATRGNTDNVDVGALTEHVLKGIEVRYAGYKTPDVEGIQNLVERTLMEFGLFDVSKAYILYRERHREIREQKQKDIIRYIEEGRIHVTKRDGSREVFSESKLRTFIARACRGFEGVVDIDGLVRQCELGIYENIKTSELAKLAIMSSKALIEQDPTAFEAITTRLFLSSLYKEALASGFSKNIREAYGRSFAASIKKGVEQGLLTKELLDFDLEKLSKVLIFDRDLMMNSRGIQTLYDRYFVRDRRTDLPTETPQFFWMRVAMGLSINEKDKESRAMQFYEVLSSMRFVASTPTLFHSGTMHPQLSSCYLTTVEDDLSHIFKAIGDNAQLSKWSGGLGNDWTNIRATGSLIKSTNVESQGVIPFLKIANDTTVAINRSGKRRGATCAYLETWHMDIEDFLDLRKTTGDERRRTHDMDTANWIPDLFMKRVVNDEDWTLFSPEEVPELHQTYGRKFEEKYIEYEKRASEGKIALFKTVKAQQLWRKMITSLFETGHPWMVFKDPANVRSPQDHVGVVHSSNLCTEITLNTSKDETAVCNLGSINLANHIKEGRLDSGLLKETVYTAMRMLDNVIDINYYPTEEAKTSNMRHRPVGLGIMGYQDALYMLGRNFDSDAGLEFADESMEIISYYAILASTELARERGTYETYKGSKWDRGILPLDSLDLLEQERGIKIEVPRTAKMDWSVARREVKQHGMRNSNTMAIAPTATISNIAGCYPSIEPIYKNIYVKSNMSGEFTVVNKFLVEDLKANELWNKTLLEKIKENDGNLQHIESLPKKLKDKYKEAFDIDPEFMIAAAARRAKWIDQSQSLNIFSATSSGKRLSDIYIYAWKMGLKSTYYLRTIAASTIEKSTLEITNRTAAINIETAGTDNSGRAYASKPESAAESRIMDVSESGMAQVQVERQEPVTVQVEDAIIEAAMQEPVAPQAFEAKVCRIDGHSMSDEENCEACQ